MIEISNLPKTECCGKRDFGRTGQVLRTPPEQIIGIFGLQ
jgi:hypothetical protein